MFLPDKEEKNELKVSARKVIKIRVEIKGVKNKREKINKTKD
jgi:hypothetical protein